MNRIVVGFDGSDTSERALERAVMIAKAAGATIAVVSSAKLSQLMRDPAGGASPVDPAEAEERTKALEKARSLLADAGVSVDFVEGHGDPADVLVQEATDSGAELVVVGTRGLGATQRLLLGSVSTKVVHHAPCDVLVVR
jgi:nucleotide-binding universal stress UspA family protein